MDVAFTDYDNVLIGRSAYIDSDSFYGPSAPMANHRKALGCIRYVIEDVLYWDVDEAVKKFDAYMIRILKMDKIISFLHFPPEIPYGHPKYILHMLYPDQVHINKRKMVEEVYTTVLDAADDGESGLKQFPREYFAGGEGFKRFCYCVSYLLENYKPMKTVKEAYHFLLSAQGKNFLCDYRLRVPADQFSIDILEVVRYITKDEPDSELWYTYYKFQQVFDEAAKK